MPGARYFVGGKGCGGGNPAAQAPPNLPSIAETSPSSNWWMLHQDLAHAANAFTDRVVPLRQLWAQSFPNTFYISQPIIGDQRVLAGMISGGDVNFVAIDSHARLPHGFWPG